MSRLSDFLRNRLGMSKASRSSRFRHERRFFSGQPIPTHSNRPSILFLTLHKAASVHVWKVLRKISEKSGLKPVDFEGFQFHLGHREFELDLSRLAPQGFLYGPFRSGIRKYGESVSALDLDAFKIILQLRDPRDTLTSQFFSYRYSHAMVPGSEPVVMAAREKVSQKNINQHVFAQAGYLRKLLAEYACCFSKENCLIVHYENMVFQPEAWLNQILEFLDLDTPRIRKAVRPLIASEPGPRNENIRSHKRQVWPGDHRRKLDPETIENLNLRYQDYFQALADCGALPDEYQIAVAKAA